MGEEEIDAFANEVADWIRENGVRSINIVDPPEDSVTGQR